MADGQMTPADFAALAGDDHDGNSWWCFLLIILFFICGFNGNGWGSDGGAAAATDAAIAAQGGYVTSSQLNDALRMSNLQQGQRDITESVNGSKYDITNALSATEARLTANQSNLLANQAANAQAQQACCNDIKYASALNTSSINENVTATGQRVLDALAADKAERQAQRIEELQRQLSEQRTQQAIAANQAANQQQFGALNSRLNQVPTYPNGFTYSAGPSPFCQCGPCCAA